MNNEAMTNVRAAEAALGAAVRAVGGKLQLGELISGMIAGFATQPGLPPEAKDAFAIRVMIDLVQLVGARRAHEIVGMVAKAGAGADFS